MTYTVTLPNGDCAEAPSFEAAILAVETLIDDATRFLRENLVIEKDGEYDAAATSLAQLDGFVA